MDVGVALLRQVFACHICCTTEVMLGMLSETLRCVVRLTSFRRLVSQHFVMLFEHSVSFACSVFPACDICTYEALASDRQQMQAASAYGAVLRRGVGGLVFSVHYRVVSFHAPCCAPLLPLFVTPPPSCYACLEECSQQQSRSAIAAAKVWITGTCIKQLIAAETLLHILQHCLNLETLLHILSLALHRV
jgi:hypothetical protein